MTMIENWTAFEVEYLTLQAHEQYIDGEKKYTADYFIFLDDDEDSDESKGITLLTNRVFDTIDELVYICCNHLMFFEAPISAELVVVDDDNNIIREYDINEDFKHLFNKDETQTVPAFLPINRTLH